MTDDNKRLDGNGLARVWTATQKLVADNINDGVPVDGVVEFAGLEADIPAGYTKIGTRDNRFLIKKTEKTIPVRSTVVTEETSSDDNVYSCNYINELNTYSTAEQVIGTWIDGKPLYRKVIEFGALPNSTIKTVAHNISNLSMVTKIYGTTNLALSNSFPIPYISASGTTSSIILYYSNTDITIQTGIDRSDLNGYITIEYTKTTD